MAEDAESDIAICFVDENNWEISAKGVSAKRKLKGITFPLLHCFTLFINYDKFYRKQYPLPAVSRLASRGDQWLHVCNIYTDRSQERLEKKSRKKKRKKENVK